MLNTGKSNYNVFKRKKNPVEDSLNIYLDKEIINRKEAAKFLGVFVNESLSWNEHIGTVAKTLSKFVYLIYKCRSFLPLQCRKLFYNTLIYPNIIYCITCWGNSPKNNLTSLITKQKKVF